MSARIRRRGFSARYVRMPRLLHELAVGRGDGSYARLLTRLAKLDSRWTPKSGQYDQLDILAVMTSAAL